MASENVNAIIARMLLRKIVSEQTLNSAAQSVLDEVREKKELNKFFRVVVRTLILKLLFSKISAKFKFNHTYI